MRCKISRFRIKSIYAVITMIFLFCVLLMLIISSLIASASSREVEQVLLSDRTADVDYISHSIGTELSNIRLQNYTVLTDDSVDQLALCGEINDHYQTVTYLQQTMNLLRTCLNQHKLIRKMRILLPGSEQMIEAEKAYTADPAFFESMYTRIVRYPNGFFDDGTEIGFWSTSPLIYSPKNLLSSRMSVTYLSESELRKTLEEFKGERKECELLITFEGNEIVSTSEMSRMTFASCSEPGNGTYRRLCLDRQEYFLIDGDTGIKELTVTMVMPITAALASLYRVQHLLRIATAAWTALLLVSCVCLYRIIYRPLQRMGKVMDQVAAGDLTVRMPQTWSVEYNRLSERFNRMTDQLQSMIRREYEYKLLMKEAEMKQLQYQISPHFMYNTYFHLRELINDGDMENAERMASMLGQYMMYIARVKNGYATLGDEIKHALIYADIQEMRFSNRLTVSREIPDGKWRDIRVPCLIVQPLVENAFYHGLKNTLKGGLVRITVTEDPDRTLIDVADNGHDLTDDMLANLRGALEQEVPEGNEGIALRNIRKRLTMMSDRNRLLLTKSDLGGLSVCLEISECKTLGGAEE